LRAYRGGIWSAGLDGRLDYQSDLLFLVAKKLVRRRKRLVSLLQLTKSRAGGLRQSGRPGTEGQGIANVLFDDLLFSGKLPFTWPRSMDQLLFDFDNLGTGDETPLFPFSYGLL